MNVETCYMLFNETFGPFDGMQCLVFNSFILTYEMISDGDVGPP